MQPKASDALRVLVIAEACNPTWTSVPLVGYQFAHPLAGRTKVPMLIGPLNGGLPWPKEFPELRRKEREWLVPVRRAYKLLPYYRSTYRHLAGVIAGSRHTASEIPASFTGKRFYLPE